MAANSFSRYRNNELMTASPSEILLSLYDGALRFAHQAREAMLAGKAKEKGVAIGRVMDIVAELLRTLKHDRAPALCEQLERLYNYMLERLVVASAQRNVAVLDEVTAHLSGLRNTWRVAVEKTTLSAPNP